MSKNNKADQSSPTMRDVAREAGVSVGTVSRVINKYKNVSEDLRLRVESAARKLEWQPNTVAASMRTSSTKTIGFVVPDIRNSLFASAVLAAEHYLRLHGYTLIVANSNNQLDLENLILSEMLSKRVTGLLYAPSQDQDQSLINSIAAFDVPVVLVEREMPIAVDSVVSDQSYGTQTATEYLIRLGHRRIALITGTEQIRPGRKRHAGYMRALEKHGLPYEKTLVRQGEFSQNFTYREMSDLVTSDDPPTAVITGGHQMLAGALRVAKTHNLSIPGDLSVVSVGDSDLAELAFPSFTTIRWDLNALGQEAAALLLTNIQGEHNRKQSKQILLPTELILRDSCATSHR